MLWTEYYIGRIRRLGVDRVGAGREVEVEHGRCLQFREIKIVLLKTNRWLVLSPE
jgi:hypothetical protein